jgi:hypothetical protein
MKPKMIVLTLTLAAASQLVSAAVSWGEFPFRGVPRHRSGLRLFSPQGQHVHDHFDNYNYVVPSTPQYGSYYTYENTHYYTPPAAYAIAPPRGNYPYGASRPSAVYVPVALRFGAFQHTEQLAARLEALTSQFCLDLHYNYQHNPGFKDVYRESYQMLQAVKFIRGGAHGGDRRTIRRTAKNIDTMVQHVQDDVRNWSGAQRRQVGELSLPAKLEEMEALTHHLLFDAGGRPEHDLEEAAPRPVN